MTHKCAMPRCQRQVLAKFLMCPEHWMKVPFSLNRAIYRTYYAGLRAATHPTREYAEAVHAAVKAVINAEAVNV